MPTPYENRIVRSETARVGDITANPLNWRVHPKRQQDVLSDVLSEVGFVQNVVVNERTGYLLDGHLRVLLLLRDFGEDAEIPVTYVDLSEEEEKLVLATIDPIASLAAADTDALAKLLADIEAPTEQISALLNDLIENANNLSPFPSEIGEPHPPLDFQSYDDEITTEHQCPRCGYVWSGTAASGRSLPDADGEEERESD
jgi:hypothetical protein